jgi:hypothetical protein
MPGTSRQFPREILDEVTPISVLDVILSHASIRLQYNANADRIPPALASFQAPLLRASPTPRLGYRKAASLFSGNPGRRPRSAQFRC